MVVHDDGTSRPYEVGVPQGLQVFQGQQEVHLAPGGHGGPHPVAETDVAEDGSPPLRHAVKLPLLHVSSVGQRRESQDLAGEDHALPPDSGNQHVGDGHGSALRSGFGRSLHR